MDENLEVEELSTEDKKKAINLQDLVYVKKYIDGKFYLKPEADAKIDSVVSAAIEAVKEEMRDDIDAAIEASSKSYTKEESDDLFLKKEDTSSLSVKAQSILDANSNSYKKISVVTADEYASGSVSSNTIYLIKE